MGDRGLVYRALRDGRRWNGEASSRRPRDRRRQVGRVLGSEHSTTSAFRVVLDEHDFLQLDDLVVVRTQVPKAGEVRTYGVVTEAEAVYEGATLRVRHPSHRRARHHAGREGAHRARRRHARRPRGVGLARPRRIGRARRRATNATRRSTSTRWAGRCPIGIGRDELPVHVDLDFFDGRKGGHMSISGISGVATKTSFALFFLRMLTAHPQRRSARAPRTCACWSSTSRARTCCGSTSPTGCFDERSRRGLGLARRRGHAVPQRALLGAAASGRSGDVLLPDTGGRHEGVEVFTLDAARVHRRGPACSSCFTDANDRAQPDPVRARARAGTAQAVRGRRGGACRARSCCATLATRRTGSWRGQQVNVAGGRAHHHRPASRWWTRIGEFLEPEDGTEPDFAWSGRVMGGTDQRVHATAARRRLAHRARWCAPASAIASTARRASVTRRRDPVAARPGAALRGGRAAERDVPPRRRRPVSACRCRWSCSTSSTSTRRARALAR